MLLSPVRQKNPGAVKISLGGLSGRIRPGFCFGSQQFPASLLQEFVSCPCSCFSGGSKHHNLLQRRPEEPESASTSGTRRGGLLEMAECYYASCLKTKGHTQTNKPLQAMIAPERQDALSTANAAANDEQSRYFKPRFLKIVTAATYSSISRSTLYELMNAGKIKSHKIGAARLLDRESLDFYISSQPAN